MTSWWVIGTLMTIVAIMTLPLGEADRRKDSPPPTGDADGDQVPDGCDLDESG